MAGYLKPASVLGVAVGLLLAACTSGGSVASTASTASSVTFQPSVTSTTTRQPGGITPSVESLTLNGIALAETDGVYLIPDPVNPGDELIVEAIITTADEAVTRSVVVPGDLLELELLVELTEGLSAVVGFSPGEGWAPVISVTDPTGRTGDVTVTVEVFDLNGVDTIDSLSVMQEFNFQHPDHAQEMIERSGLDPASVRLLGSGATAVSLSRDSRGSRSLSIDVQNEWRVLSRHLARPTAACDLCRTDGP